MLLNPFRVPVFYDSASPRIAFGAIHVKPLRGFTTVTSWFIDMKYAVIFNICFLSIRVPKSVNVWPIM